MKRYAIAALLVLGNTGCSTLIHGPTQRVRVTSNPPGAMATVTAQTSQRGYEFLVPVDETVRTPAELTLRRDTNYRIEFQHEGYKLATAKLRSEYDFVGSPLVCGLCEAVGALPRPDVKEQALPIRMLSSVYTYPVGAIGALGQALRLLSPEALVGHSFKLKAENDGYFDEFSGLGTPTVDVALEPLN